MTLPDPGNTSFDLEKELEQRKLDALAEFAAGAGHEINNPLAVISGHAQIMLRETDDPNQRYHLGIILGQVKRAYEMIADIRTFARPPLPQIRVFEPESFLNDFIEDQRQYCDERSICLLFDYSDCKEISQYQILSDPSLLDTILSLLIRNSLEALPEDGKIEFHAVLMMIPLEQRAVLSVDLIDNGPGIPVEIRDQVFSPYFSGRSAGRGLGFGLSKVWRFLQQLNGSITSIDRDELLQGCGWHLEIPMEIQERK